MRSKIVVVVALIVAGLLAFVPGTAFAQNVNVEWNRWDAQITVRSNSNQIQIAETQEVHVLDGSLHFGTRTWDGSVQIQSVYLIGSDGSPRQLSQSSNAGGYQVSQANNQTTLRYNFPNTVNAGDTFTVQINYLASTPTAGVLDWRVIPGDHAYPIKSSTTRIQFPDGQAPDSSLVRVTTGNASVQMNGNAVIIQSNGTIPANQQLGIQMPFGSGVGAANGNSGNSGNSGSDPFNPNNGSNGGVGDPNGTGDGGNVINLPSGGTLLLLICGGALLLLFGGGGLLRSLLGGFLGGNILGGGNQGGYSGGNQGGGLFGSGGNIGGSPFNSSTPSEGRGFRQSSNQNRELPTINNDKGTGGGAGFG